MGNKSPTPPRCSDLTEMEEESLPGARSKLTTEEGSVPVPRQEFPDGAKASACLQELTNSTSRILSSELSSRPRQRRGEGLLEFHGRIESQDPLGTELNSVER